jgi:hypothetical protein
LKLQPLWLEFFGPHARKGITMSELRNRMTKDMQLAGLAEGTRREYLRAVGQLATYYMVSPDQLSDRLHPLPHLNCDESLCFPRSLVTSLELSFPVK